MVKLKKTLYVGIGGTGVSTILKIKKHFVDIYDEIPPMIGFLCIDTDGAITSKSINSNRGSQINLDPSECLVCTVKGALNVYKNNPKEYDWVPARNVDKLANIQGGGAGQIRSNGRFIAYFNSGNIKSGIRAAVTRVMQLMPPGSRYVVDANTNGVDYPVNVNVVASVAGGSGSGMLVDVLCVIREVFEALTVDFRLYPWLVLPEIFRSMNAGPSMNNVLYNCYGTLRTLDYIQHYDPQQPAINLGYSKVDEPLFDYAYLINSTNRAGVSFGSLEDLTDVVAKCAFLPANSLGAALASPFDNIMAQKISGTYDILQKKAWAASAGSAELIYDSRAVGRAYAYRIISQICNSLIHSSDNGVAEADRFVDNARIRENNGRNDIIDAMLSPAGVEYDLQVDEDTQKTDIQQYLDYHYGLQRLEPILNKNLAEKLSTTEMLFNDRIDIIMARKEGKVDAAIRFISGLEMIINDCRREMEQEKGRFAALNQQPQQWGNLLRLVTNKGVAGLFKKRSDAGVEMVKVKLSEDVTNHREELRREWAIKFYNSFENIINAKKTALEKLSVTLQSISEDCNKELTTELNSSKSASKFQITLHNISIEEACSFTIDDTIKTEFLQFLNGGMASWVDESKKAISKRLMSFAGNTKAVQNALNTNINDVLRKMPEEQLKDILSHLQTLAAPLWTYDTQGFAAQSGVLDNFVVVGVDDIQTNILCTDARYNTFFDTNQNRASYVSTNQSDRIYILVVEDLLPIYAVSNFMSYKRDHEDRVARNVGMSNYIDEKLNNRINSENFSLIPQKETDNVLQLWVWGFIFKYINYDSEANKYWIRSKQQGNPLEDFRYDLGNQRDVAYDIFRSERLYVDVEEPLNDRIARRGWQEIQDKLDEIQMSGSYKEKYSQISPIELANLYNPKFRAVKNLLEQEIRLMS